MAQGGERFTIVPGQRSEFPDRHVVAEGIARASAANRYGGRVCAATLAMRGSAPEMGGPEQLMWLVAVAPPSPFIYGAGMGGTPAPLGFSYYAIVEVDAGGAAEDSTWGVLAR